MSGVDGHHAAWYRPKATGLRGLRPRGVLLGSPVERELLLTAKQCGVILGVAPCRVTEFMPLAARLRNGRGKSKHYFRWYDLELCRQTMLSHQCSLRKAAQKLFKLH